MTSAYLSMTTQENRELLADQIQYQLQTFNDIPQVVGKTEAAKLQETRAHTIALLAAAYKDIMQGTVLKA